MVCPSMTDIMQRGWNDNLTEQPKHTGGNPSPCHFSPQNPQRVTWIYALIFSVRSHTKITWAMARHFFMVKSRI
jgi:hypothetical protein